MSTAVLTRSTCIEVAQLAGVSQATVSRVFTGRAPVSEKTRQKILDAASQLGYRPNPLASGLRGSPTRTLGIAWSLSGPHDSEGMVRRLALKGHARGYATHVADHLSDPATCLHLITDFADRGVDAVVLYDSQATLWPMLQQAGLLHRIARWTVVTQVRPGFEQLQAEGIPTILHNRDQAICQVVRYLVQTGRRSLAYLTPCISNRGKADLFIAQCRAEGLPEQHIQVFDTGDGCSQSFFDALAKTFPHPQRLPFDALFCSTDQGAMAAHAWLRSVGWRVPEDVALIGFNDSDTSPWCDPPLASVARQDDELTDQIEHSLFDEDPLAHPAAIEISMRFVWRASAGPQWNLTSTL